MDIFGKALTDYFNKKKTETLWLHNNYGQVEEMPIDVFFRTEDEMPDLELYALGLCKGKTMDIGAGVGSHALLLQENGIDVTAVEISAQACAIMQVRGIKKMLNQDIKTYSGDKFDTLLLLMNGIGLAGTIDGLKEFLNHAKTLLNAGGQLLFDSSDIAYLYFGETIPTFKYYGEISYQYEYMGDQGDWFNWLYIDSTMLDKVCRETGWNLQVIYEDDMDQYLARLTLED